MAAKLVVARHDHHDAPPTKPEDAEKPMPAGDEAPAAPEVVEETPVAPDIASNDEQATEVL